MATTFCPSASRQLTTLLPTFPVAPVTAIIREFLKSELVWTATTCHRLARDAVVDGGHHTLLLSLSIHSLMYGGQRRTSIPSDSPAIRNRTKAMSTSVTSPRSNTSGDGYARTSAWTSAKCSASIRPMKRSVVVPACEVASIFKVICVIARSCPSQKAIDAPHLTHLSTAAYVLGTRRVIGNCRTFGLGA